MQFPEFRELIRRLEAEAARDPRGFTLRVAAFGALGYLYVVGVFLLLAGAVLLVPRLTHGHHTILLVHPVILLVPIAIVLGQAVIVRPAPAHGVPLTRERAPALFALIDDAADALDAPHPDRVLLTPDYDCAAMQRPRLGIFGWPENVLLIGLPMLEALSRARFRAVIAHELGHLLADHGTFGGRMHAVSGVWGRMMSRLREQRGATVHLFAPFFRWYGPRFHAMGFVLGRRQEHFADLCSRRVAGARASRSALVRIEVMARWHAEVRRQTLHGPVRASDLPPGDAIGVIARRMREDPPAEQAARWLEEALRTETGYENTHPALSDRVRAIDPSAQVAPADARAEPGPSAAQELLAGELDAYTREAGALWAAHWAGAWKERHEELREAARTATPAADGGEDGAPPTRDEAWRALTARLEVEGEHAAAAPLASFVEAHPDHAPAHYRLGRVLLRDGDAAGLGHLERAMELDTDAVPAACDLAKDFLRAQGRGPEADAYMRRWWEFADLAAKADDERRILRPKDRFEPAELAPEALDLLREHVARQRWIRAAFIARKVVELRPERPCIVLGLRVDRPWWKYSDPRREARQMQEFLSDAAVPEGTWVFLLEHELRWARARLARVEGAALWTRSQHGAAAAIPSSRSRAA